MPEDTKREMLKHLPAVDRLLSLPAILDIAQQMPRFTVLAAVRQVLNEFRSEILNGQEYLDENLSEERMVYRVVELARALHTPSLRRVINGTGVILHTGLGRAVLPDAARAALDAVAAGHCNLETDLETGARGSRNAHISHLLASLCGAEAGIAVNNNAAAVLLTLNTLAAGKEVIVSRGQLIEIGGSFRLPDIMARAGARLVEVGTTNRTRLNDYEAAITSETGLIMRVHPSNFRMVGFTSEVAIGDLVQLGHKCGIRVVEDVGSGSLVDMACFGLKGEPLVSDSIRSGADAVLFSGDKLLGGPQSGLIVGRTEIVDAMAENPLSRALRVGKLTTAALEGTLRLYTDPPGLAEAIPALQFISRSVDDIGRAAEELRLGMESISGDQGGLEVVDGFSEVGGGSLPGECLPTKLLAITWPHRDARGLARAFRQSDPPIIGRVGEDRFLLDLRTISDEEIPLVLRAAEHLFRRYPPVGDFSDR